MAAEASAQCPALAPPALGPHAALLPPVALHRPVALPTVSDPEEVTVSDGDGGAIQPTEEAMSPLSCCALSLPRV